MHAAQLNPATAKARHAVGSTMHKAATVAALRIADAILAECRRSPAASGGVSAVTNRATDGGLDAFELVVRAVAVLWLLDDDAVAAVHAKTTRQENVAVGRWVLRFASLGTGRTLSASVADYVGALCRSGLLMYARALRAYQTHHAGELSRLRRRSAQFDDVDDTTATTGT